MFPLMTMVSFITVVALSSTCLSGTQFTENCSIMAISREDQTNALAIHLLKNELTLSDALVVLTTYRRVTSEEYMLLAHQPGARGTVTLAGGASYRWEIEPGYAAELTMSEQPTVYLLRPGLGKDKGEKTKGADKKTGQ